MAKDRRLVYMIRVVDDNCHEAMWIVAADELGGRPDGARYLAANAPADLAAKWLKAQADFEDVCSEVAEFVYRHAAPPTEGPCSVPWRREFGWC